MLEIYIARHGQTEWNKEGRLQGWLNSALTDKGIESAKMLGEKINHLNFDAYYTSPSPRAYETLELATQKPKADYFMDQRLMEIGLGVWQGQLIEDIKKEYAVEYDMYYHDPVDFKLEGAESYHDLKIRVDQFINELTQKHFTQNLQNKILVITHGVTLMMMRLLFNGGEISDLADYSVADNAKLHVYKYDGKKFINLIEEV